MEADNRRVLVPIFAGLANALMAVVVRLATQYQPTAQILQRNPIPLKVASFFAVVVFVLAVVYWIFPRIRPLISRSFQLVQVGARRASSFAYSTWGRRVSILLLGLASFSLLYTVTHNIWSFILLGIVLLSGYWVFYASWKATPQTLPLSMQPSFHAMSTNRDNAEFTQLYRRLANLRTEVDFGIISEQEFRRETNTLLEGMELEPYQLQKLADDLGFGVIAREIYFPLKTDRR